MILEGCTGDVYAVAFYKDFVISSGYDMNIRVWDSFSGMLLKTLYGHTHIVRCLAIKDAEVPLIVSGSWDHTVCVWSLETGKLISKLIGHSSRVKAVSISNFSPDIIFSGGEDRTVKLWDLNSSELLFTLDGPHNVLTVAIGECKLKPQSVKKKSRDKSNDIFYSKYLLAAGGTDHYIRIWNSSGILHKELRGHQQDITSLVFIQEDEEEGPFILLLSSSNDWTIRLWNAVTGFSLRVFRRHNANIISCSLSHRFGKTLIISLSTDGNIQIWNLATTEAIVAISKETKYHITSFATSSVFVGNRLQIVFGGSDGHLELFAVECPNLFVHNSDDDENNSHLDMSIFRNHRKNKSSAVKRSASDERSKSNVRAPPPILPLPVLTTRARALALEPRPPSPYSLAGAQAHSQLQSPRQLLLSPHSPVGPKKRLVPASTTLQKNNKSPKKYKKFSPSGIPHPPVVSLDKNVKSHSKKAYPHGNFNDELDSSSMLSLKFTNQCEIDDPVNTQSVADILRAGGIPIGDDICSINLTPESLAVPSTSALLLRHSHSHRTSSQGSPPSPRPRGVCPPLKYDPQPQPQPQSFYARSNYNANPVMAPGQRLSPPAARPGPGRKLISLQASGGESSPTSPSLSLSYRWDNEVPINVNKDFSANRPVDSAAASTANNQGLHKLFYISNGHSVSK